MIYAEISAILAFLNTNVTAALICARGLFHIDCCNSPKGDAEHSTDVENAAVAAAASSAAV